MAALRAALSLAAVCIVPALAVATTRHKPHFVDSCYQGYWAHDPAACTSFPVNMTCTASGHVWNADGCALQTSTDACARLAHANIGKLLFVGDSYVRHAYEGMLLMLTGDFSSGALNAGSADEHPECLGDGQFEEVACRHHVKTSDTLCDGHVTVALKYGAAPAPDEDDSQWDVIVWGVGNHPVDGNYTTRLGINDAAVYADHMFRRLCHPDTGLSFMRHDGRLDTRSPHSTRKVFWMSSHCRSAARFNDEQDAKVHRYVVESSRHLWKLCGVPTIDTYTLTSNLVRFFPEDAQQLSWDGTHWSRAVNLLKAVLVLHAIGAA